MDLTEKTKISAEGFLYEYYDSGWRLRLDFPNFDLNESGDAIASAVARKFVGWCEGSRLRVRPRYDEIAIMCEDKDGKFWFHHTEMFLYMVLNRYEKLNGGSHG